MCYKCICTESIHGSRRPSYTYFWLLCKKHPPLGADDALAFRGSLLMMASFVMSRDTRPLNRSNSQLTYMKCFQGHHPLIPRSVSIHGSKRPRYTFLAYMTYFSRASSITKYLYTAQKGLGTPFWLLPRNLSALGADDALTSRGSLRMMVSVVMSRDTRVPGLSAALSSLLRHPTTYRGPLDAFTMNRSSSSCFKTSPIICPTLWAGKRGTGRAQWRHTRLLRG